MSQAKVNDPVMKRQNATGFCELHLLLQQRQRQ
jgi:hypothetical protein